jgi:uncharacterized protein involved in exopolysaccharide biosynthesis/Mrp family chromosome partitioning ATPase
MLNYDQPIVRTKAEKPLAPSSGLSVMDLGQLLWRRKAGLIGAALIAACAAVALGKSLSPKYTAIAQLYVDPRELQLVDRELTPRAQDVSGLAMVVESQARLITSNSVLLPVIQANRLDQDPEFGGTGDARRGLSALLDVIGLQGGASEPTRQGETAALDALGRHITVRKTERSFVVDIEVWSKDPAKAAQLANAIASAYLAESRNSQAIAARRATNDLSGRLKELQQRLRNAETALATYKAQNNFVGTQDTLISDQQLSAANQRLAAAHAQTLDAQARYDQIEASRRTSNDPGAIAEALQSPTIANLRAQYAEARKRYAEQSAELGPRHPAIRQAEQQVEDMRRTIGEEIARFALSAKNDLARARDYEAATTKALETQKQQAVQLSQAAVHLRELERDVDASRDVYQSFLKRSRETEEQESLNTSAARIIGEATVPQRRSFPPAMGLLAMIGFVFGGLAAAGLIIALDRLRAETRRPDPADAIDQAPARQADDIPRPEPSPIALPEKPAIALQESPVVTLQEKPVIALLQGTDVIRTLGGILGTTADVTRLGWPTLRPSAARTDLLTAFAGIRAVLGRRTPDGTIPVAAVIGAGAGEDRSIAALNFALAAARDGARVLLIDADDTTRSLSRRAQQLDGSEPGRHGWLSIGSKDGRAIGTTNGITILPAADTGAGKTAKTICTAIAQACKVGSYDFVVLDGPALPWSAEAEKVLECATALIAVLPARSDLDQSLDAIITALGGAEHKLAGVVVNELDHPAVSEQRSRQYA